MQRFKNILFFSSPGSNQGAAVRRACALAKNNAARLTIMSVVKDRPIAPFLSGADIKAEALQKGVIDEFRQQTEALTKQMLEQGIDVHTKVVSGTPFIEVIRQVLRAGHDLVILAAEDKPKLITRLFGSTAMHLMRKCPCPVWVVKAGVGKRFNRILAAVDITDDAWDDKRQSINPLIAQLASSLARMDRSDLHLLQVWSVPFEGYLEVRGGMSEQGVRRIRKEAKRSYARRLNSLMETLDMAGVPMVRAHLKHGDDPAATIVKLVRKEKIDLLIMGTVSRTGLRGFFIGNTAEEVLSAVGCSVLTVKPADFVSPVVLERE